MRAPARLIPDASVAVQWFVMEEGSAFARRLRRTFRGRMIAPDLLLSECVNAAWKRIRKRQMSSERAEEMAATLPDIVALVPPDADLARRALFIAGEMNHPAYDCFYLAFAEREGTAMATDDKRLLRKVRGTLWEDCAISLGDAAREWADLGGDGL